MSQSTRAAALGRPSGSAVLAPMHDAVEEDDERLVLDAEEIVDRIWRIATSMPTAVILMIVLAGLGLVGTMVIQAPSGMTSEPGAYRAWVESLRPRYGGWTYVFDTLGFYSIFSSWWFKGIVLALVTSISACSAKRVRGLWKTAVKPRMRMTSAFYDRAPLGAIIVSAMPAESTLEQVRRVFHGRGFRTVVAREGDDIHLYADRFRWAPFGTVVGHLSLILILVGALVGSGWGFRNSSFAVTVGSRVDVGYGTGLTVEATSFNDSYYASGEPSDYASHLVLYRDGVLVAEQTIRVNEPLQYGDIKFFQSFFGPSAAVKVADSTGAVLFQSGVPLLWSSEDGRRRVGRMDIDNPKLTIFVAEAASGRVDPAIKAGQVRFEVYRNETDTAPIAMQVASQGQPVQLAGLTFTFEREHQFTGLIVAKDPGQVLVWLGAVLLVSGLFLVFFFPNRRVWARIHRNGAGSELRLGAIARHDASFGPDFEHLVGDIRPALGGAGAAGGRG